MSLHLKGITAVLGTCVTLGGFAAWILSRSEAYAAETRQMVQHVEQRFDVRDAGLRDEMRRVETKVDRVLEAQLQMLKEMRRR